MRRLATLACTLLGGCALLWGFEDHEPFPEQVEGGGGTGPSSSSTSGAAGATGPGGSGGEGASGGGGAPGVDVLLITDATFEAPAIGMYDATDGAYLGDFLPPPSGGEPYTLSFPYHAAQGPDGRVYLADRSENTIFRFEPSGAFEGVFASDLEAIEALAFRDDRLFVALDPFSGTPVVAQFDLTGQRLADFVRGSVNPQGIAFLETDTMLLSHNGSTTDAIRLYDVTGNSFNDIAVATSPVQVEPLANGNFLLAETSAYRELTLAGQEVMSIDGSGGVGIHGLGNGNWVVTDIDGILALDPDTGLVAETIRVGTSFWRVGRATLPPSVVGQ